MRRILHVFLVPVLLVLTCPAAHTQSKSGSDTDTLLRLLKSKGVITEAEASVVRDAGAVGDANDRLARILISKGVITQQEYETQSPTVVGTMNVKPSKVVPAVITSVAPEIRGASYAPPQASASEAAPKVVPAVAPLRVLPITVPKKGGLLPDIKLGSGPSLRPYGFFKISEVYQTASHGGPTFGSNDFPQGPLLLGDTGPDGDPQFHIKNRAFRAGVDFEWPELGPDLTLTGKLEFDFEGNFTNVNNRNISANRSSQPSLRLAWVRLDTKLGGLPWFAQFGQDWSIFGSSTLMDLFETAGFGFAQGNLYERMPMFRTGVQFGKGDFKFQPEFAIALPSFGEPGLDSDQRTRFGSRVGPESGRPEIQARTVFQFPLSKAPGVVPAQIIFSYDNAERAEIVPAENLPGVVTSAFPTGVRLASQRNAWTAEVQLPTSWVTVVGKYYRGGDLRYFFQGQFNDVFTDLGTATPIATATSFSGRSIPFGCVGAIDASCTGGQIVVGQIRPVRGQGGFLQVGLPLSRWAHANPEGRNAGWTLYLTYGIDSAFSRDTLKTGANGLLRTDHASMQLRYKLNKWVSFVQETTYLETLADRGLPADSQKLFRGVPARTAHAWRNEFGPIFNF